MKIPKLGHVVWVGPHRPPQEMIDSWPKMNPDMVWTVWRDHSSAQGWENQEQIDARAARNEFNGVADCIRYEILYRCGGIVVDADSIAERPLSEGDFFEQETSIACFESETVRPGVIGCGFLGAPQGHPFFRACIDAVAEASLHEMAWKAVGPQLMGRVADAHPDLIHVYPARLANPVHYSGAKAPGDFPVYASQGWGSTKGYGALRKLPCTCNLCWQTALRPSWG